MSLGKKKMLSQGAAAAPPISGGDHFQTVLYTGNCATQSTNSLSSQVGATSFQPDFIWFRNRSGAYMQQLYNSIRGANLCLNTGVGSIGSRTGKEAEFNDSGNDLTSFNTSGFTIGQCQFGGVNETNFAHLAWCWKGGGTPVNNTAGTNASSVSANTTAGFSAVQFTANSGNITVGHGLTAAVPELILLKTTSFTDDWFVNCIGLTNQSNKALRLNATSGEETGTSFWNNTAPTSTTFSVGNGISVNGQSYMAYCFHSVAGYQKVNKYTGNSGTNFISTSIGGDAGFQPRWVLMKNTANGYSWIIQDSERGTSKFLYANLNNTEVTSSTHITSFNTNGFTLGSNADVNFSGDTYIYLAIA